MDYERITYTIIYAIVVTIILYFLKNMSNTTKEYIIPSFVVVSCRYFIGNWHKETFSMTGISFWITITLISFITVLILNKITINQFLA